MDKLAGVSAAQNRPSDKSPSLFQKGIAGAARIITGASNYMHAGNRKLAIALAKRGVVGFIDRSDYAAAAACAVFLYRNLGSLDERVKAADEILQRVNVDNARDVLVGIANDRNNPDARSVQEILSPLKEQNDQRRKDRPAVKVDDRPFEFSHSSRVRIGFCGNADEHI